MISLWISRLFTLVKLLSVTVFLKICKCSHWQHLFIFFSVSNYFDSDQCCFSKFKHFIKISNVLLPFGNKLQIRKNGSADFADRTTTGVCNRTHYKDIKSCPRKCKQVKCQPVSSLSLTSWNYSKCQKISAGQKRLGSSRFVWVFFVFRPEMKGNSLKQTLFFLKKAGVRDPAPQISHEELHMHPSHVLCERKSEISLQTRYRRWSAEKKNLILLWFSPNWHLSLLLTLMPPSQGGAEKGGSICIKYLPFAFI